MIRLKRICRADFLKNIFFEIFFKILQTDQLPNYLISGIFLKNELKIVLVTF